MIFWNIYREGEREKKIINNINENWIKKIKIIVYCIELKAMCSPDDNDNE